MTRLPMLLIAGVLAIAPRPAAACRWFGTQLECDVRGNRVVIGTQADDEPTYAKSFAMPLFHDDRGFPGDHDAASGRPLDVRLQDVGADPSLCRKIGNETYCY